MPRILYPELVEGATLWTLDAAKKEAKYFHEYVGMDLKKIDPKKKSVVAKKAKDGVWDVVVNIKKFNREIFDATPAVILA